MIRKPMKEPNVINLDGPDGNAYVLMGATARCARDLGYASDETDVILRRMMNGNYFNLVKVFEEYFGEYFILETKDDNLMKHCQSIVI